MTCMVLDGNLVFHPHDFRVQLSSELLAVGVAFAQAIEMRRRSNGALAAQVDEMRHERHVLPVTNLLAHIAIAEFVSEKARRQRTSLPRGGFEQRGFEGQNGLAARTRSFRKKHHQRAGLQRGFDLIHCLSSLCALLAMDKHRSRQLGKPAQYRPLFHVPFGDKYARRERRQEENIEITQMIADEQAA